MEVHPCPPCGKKNVTVDVEHAEAKYSGILVHEHNFSMTVITNKIGQELKLIHWLGLMFFFKSVCNHIHEKNVCESSIHYIARKNFIILKEIYSQA